MKAALAFAIALAAFAPGLIHAADDADPEARRAAIVLRAMAFDRNLAARAGDRVVLAVLVPSGAPDGSFEPFVRGLQQLEKLTMKSRPFAVVTIEAGEPAELERRLAAEHVSAVVIGPGLDAKVALLTGLTRRSHVLSIAWSLDDLARGACLAVAFEGSKPRIHVNLPACVAEGIAFESQMLDLAKVSR